MKYYDVVIIGAGLFGLYAAYLFSSRRFKVAILEEKNDILERASKINQARIHRGYHYPRSFETAQKTANYYYRFCDDFKFAILNGFKQYYAIAKQGSKTSVQQYVQFCKKLDIPLKEVAKSLFFQKEKVEALFQVEEACFNYLKIKEYFLRQFTNHERVHIYYQVSHIYQRVLNSKYILTINGAASLLMTPLVINTTYSNVNFINKIFGFPGYAIKYELCEIRIYKMSNNLSKIGLTVMDGPFLSLMPFRDGSEHSMCSVTYSVLDTSYNLYNPYNLRSVKKKITKKNGEKTEALARSYLKNNIDFAYKGSFFEVKPILISSEKDDSRPTLITLHSKNPYYVSVLSGKISTIYDLENKLKDYKLL